MMGFGKKVRMERERAEEEECKRQQERASATFGEVIRKTAYALGHGDGRVSIDGGRTWHPKSDLVCSGSYLSLKLELPDGSCCVSDYDFLEGCMSCVGSTRQRILDLSRSLNEISKSLSGDDPYAPAISAKDHLWCLVVLLDGDVVFGG